MTPDTTKLPKIEKTEEEWKRELTPEQYKILRKKGTEIPYTGEYLNTTDKGMYQCAACGNPLFSSETKLNSSSMPGWPSFYDAIPGSIEFHDDDSYGMQRIEVTCARCGGHLGHVFDDGPQDTTGKHYCINSACLLLKKDR